LCFYDDNEKDENHDSQDIQHGLLLFKELTLNTPATPAGSGTWPVGFSGSDPGKTNPRHEPRALVAGE
jgi:hypothetical protein